MRVGVIADTHDQVARVKAAVALLSGRGASHLFHCGDLTGVEVVRACGALPAYFAFGNNDHDRAGLEAAMRAQSSVCVGDGSVVELKGRRLGLTHGDSKTKVRELLETAPDYLFLGHSHHKGEWKQGKTRVINPGALHRAPKWTVVLLDLETEVAEFLELH